MKVDMINGFRTSKTLLYCLWVLRRFRRLWILIWAETKPRSSCKKTGSLHVNRKLNRRLLRIWKSRTSMQCVLLLLKSEELKQLRRRLRLWELNSRPGSLRNRSNSMIRLEASRYDYLRGLLRKLEGPRLLLLTLLHERLLLSHL